MSVKGDKFFALAEKKANKFNYFGLTKEQNLEDAAELYAQAAAQFKMVKDFRRAGTSYERAAQCNMGADNQIEAKQNWRESGKCYRHCNIEKAQEAYMNAITLNLESDRYGQAARLQEEIGDMLVEDEHIEEAISAYEQSADYYETENDTGNRNKRLLIVAHMCGKAHQWQKAIDIYEKTANSSVDSNLLRWKVKEYCFKAMLLQLCLYAERDQETGGVNWQKVRSINERYCDMSDIYASSRECKFMHAVLEAMPLEMAEFTDANENYNRITKLDSWCVDLLLFVQRYIEWKTREAPIVDLMGDGAEVGGDGNYSKNSAQPIKQQPESNIFAQAKNYNNNNNNNYSNNNKHDMNNNNTSNYESNEPPDLSGAPDADLL